MNWTKTVLIYCSYLSDVAKAGERGVAKYLGPGLVRGGGLNLCKTSGHGCDCQEGWGPVMYRYLLVLGCDPGSRQPWMLPLLLMHCCPKSLRKQMDCCPKSLRKRYLLKDRHKTGGRFVYSAKISHH